ncbi:mitochondrial import receptor subunit TOM70-like [Dendronephthya gigantea]|uniref:mitochondrial import receptor subunit TOM70-like n=1 Tax=Dendronephthya gigantea TaxID=151771 RepID=UPI00106BF567|nr:mitochondrial import receptor subunit TOM70-like [Dendronephthya gigantea]
MSSTQESDGDFQSWFGSSKWKTALYVGLPLLGVGVVCVYLWKRRSVEDTTPRPNEDVETPEPTLTPKEEAQKSKLKGNELFKAKKYEEAIECYSSAISICPKENKADLAIYFQNRAAAHEQLKNYDDVISDCKQALQYNKKYTKAYLRRAKAYEMLDQKQNCLQDLTAVSMIEGLQNSSWMVQMDQILKQIGTEKAAEHFKNRVSVLPSNVFIKAYLDSFSEDVTLTLDESDNVETEPYLQAVREALDDKFDNIISLCTKEIDKPEPSPYLAKAICLRGTMHTLMSMQTEALKDFDRVISLEDASVKVKVNALVKRASIKVQMTQNTQEAYKDFNEAIKLDPENGDIFHHRGQINALTDKLPEAKEDFERCVEINPSFVSAKVQLAFCIYKTAMTQQSTLLLQGAKRMFNDIIASHPTHADAYSLFAQLNQEMQDFDAADKNFDTAISIEPNNPVHYVYKALLVCQWKRDIQKAMDLLKKAVTLDPKCDFAFETLATLQVQSGEFKEAIENFDKALELVRSESEMAHTFSIRQAALAQEYVTKVIGLTPPRLF